MRQFLLLVFLLSTLFIQAQNVGIGVSVPLEKLHIDSNVRIGVNSWSSPANNRFLKFGDGNFVTIGEVGLDDRFEFAAREFLFRNSGGYGAGNGKVGININTSPTAYLEVNGNVKITDGTQGEGKILTSAADGTASWQFHPSVNTAFHASVQNANIAVTDATDLVVIFDTEEFDDGLGYNSSTGEFTAPSAGVYHFDAKVVWQLTPSTQCLLTLYLDVNGTTYEKTQESFLSSAGTDSKALNFGTNVKLGVGDVVKIYVRQDSGAPQELSIQKSSFSGNRLY